MPPFGIGDVVWVRVGHGDHEEPATVVELGCATDSGEDGVTCKLHVSFFEATFALDQVRAMPSGRPTRQRSSSAAVRRKVVSPSPTQVGAAGKQKEVFSRENSNESQKKRKFSAPSSPHFDKSSKPVKVLRNALKDESEAKALGSIVSEATDSSDDDPPVKSKKPAAGTTKATVARRDKASKAPLGSKVKAPLKKLFNDEKNKTSDADFSYDSAESDDDSDASNDASIAVRKKSAVKTKSAPVAKRKQQVKPAGKGDQNSDASNDVRIPLPKKPAVKTKSAPVAKRKQQVKPSVKGVDGSDDEANADLALAALKKPAGKSKTNAATKSKSAAKQKPVVEAKPPAADDESDSDTDRPYKVEYSPSGRATCRRCDETIPKGAVRISHIPLFRGKVRYPT